MLFEIIRVWNCIMAGFAAVIGVKIVCGVIIGVPVFDTALVFLSVFLITGAGNVINDFFDADVDAINRPKRPIPSGRINRKNTFYLSLLLFGLGIALAGFINTICFIIAFVNSVLLVIYARNLKSTVLIGNLCVGYLAGSVFLFGGAILGTTGLLKISWLFVFAMFATVTREIAKDIEDMNGDAAMGITTLPIQIGKKHAEYFALAFGITTVLLSPLPCYMGFSVWYLVVIIFADFYFLVAILQLKNNVTYSSKLFKRGMAIALLAFVIG